MSNILDEIVEVKKLEVERLRRERNNRPRNDYSNRTCISLKEKLLDPNTTGIIAEFKRKSPSKGWFNRDASAVEIVSQYEKHGAACASVLTDSSFFGGNLNDLYLAREAVNIPLLRKDFIIDEVQIAEAKRFGADLILLIAAILTPERVSELSKEARNYGLEVLLELHDEVELDHIIDDIDLIGINNRDLKTFEVDIDRSLRMAEKIPSNKIKIAESGISSVENIRLFRENGFKGFLIGENFMKAEDPGKEFQHFVNKLYIND
ncbi:MAG TPA: indole-3-glycerol phosphate synthase TrpC [Chitinophagaceae bacterium]|nr:indole-3-glycerol phosphate synthase TrpC [Chitinophagaceae bacterium]